MKFLKENKLLIIAVLLFFGAAIGFYYFFFAGGSQKATEQQPIVAQQEVVPTIAPQSVGLVFEARNDGKAVKFSIEKPDGITSAEYEITYTATGDLERGITGTLDGTSGWSTEYLDLGSCSSGKCKYDTGVSKVNLLLKITKDNGKVYSVEKSLSL